MVKQYIKDQSAAALARAPSGSFREMSIAVRIVAQPARTRILVAQANACKNSIVPWKRCDADV
jgi:hypothetical protein